jgi:hypothetical protein
MPDGAERQPEALLELQHGRLHLLDAARLQGPGGRDWELVGLSLDTGCSVPMILPRSLLGERPEDAWDDRLETWGGSVRAIVVPCTLELPPWNFRLEAWFIDAGPHAWVGLPVLQHFDLLLRASPRGPRLVGPHPRERLSAV